MFKVARVEIDGFWGSLYLKTDLHDDVNIFIGKNGSGKTTFINFLEGTLTGDIDLLESLQFNEIRLLLKEANRSRSISITRINKHLTYDILKFKIGRHSVELPLIPKEMEYRRRRLHPTYLQAFNEISETLRQLVNISWISVHREILEDEYRDPTTRRTITEKYPIDRRIESLTRRFTEYQLRLQSEINRVSDAFRKNVLTSILYNEKFDKIEFLPENELDLNVVQEKLVRTYQDLGALDTEISDKIGEHIRRINKSIETIKKSKQTKGQITIDDVLPISLLFRTQHIIDLSTGLEKTKKDLLRPIDTYLQILKTFLEDKNLQLNPNLIGQLKVTKGNTTLPLDQLSSGEKQLFILLTEALLESSQRFVFIADEPELSLHIKWQKQVISSVRTLNNNAQIIVATHSPEIASGWRKKIIRMEQIINDSAR